MIDLTTPSLGDNKFFDFNRDAFSHGQIQSKLWLCEALESFSWSSPLTIAVYGGWYGMLPFLLLSRGKLPIEKIISIDIDPLAVERAKILNEAFIAEDGPFWAMAGDVNQKSWAEELNSNLVINTSCEHMTEKLWFEKIPRGVFVALQSTDMPHREHIDTVDSLQEMNAKYKTAEVLSLSEKQFSYPSLQFTRFQLIGLR